MGWCSRLPGACPLVRVGCIPPLARAAQSIRSLDLRKAPELRSCLTSLAAGHRRRGDESRPLSSLAYGLLSLPVRVKRITLLVTATVPLLLSDGARVERLAMPASPTALLNYLRVGTAQVALISDTFTVRGRSTKLKQTTFEDLFRIFKPATVNGRGDASTSLNWVCYRLGADASTSLILESDEMGGGQYIDGFEIVPAGSRPDLERECVALDILPSDFETDRGIRLGLTRRDVRKRLGVTGRDSAGVVIFERGLDKSHRLRDGTREQYFESSSFTLRFRDDRVVEISGWRIDST